MISAANKRAKKVDKLMKRYNELIDLLAENERPEKLQRDDFKNLGIGDKLWEIDMVRANEKWAFSPAIRRGIDALYDRDRSIEEIKLQANEASQFAKWNGDRLDRIGQFLRAADRETFFFGYIHRIGVRIAQPLKAMIDLEHIAKETKFPSSFPVIFDCIKQFSGHHRLYNVIG